MIKKILIANRGEIAVRIMRTCREMGIRSVAVFSDADRTSMHVRYADEAYHIGASIPQESYLSKDKIIEVAKKSKVDAIHPGYGFLSENADFAKKCRKAGIIFIGPSAHAIATMGDKITARQTMISVGVPVVPGTNLKLEDTAYINQIVEDIGLPIMIKASAGGGGKGMRLVRNKKELTNSIISAKSEALAAFGDDSVYIEKYIENPRHIEFQVFGDAHGNVIHLFERDCSVQRRHQKIIEETPSPFISHEVRNQMGHHAVLAAKAVNYEGAGTIEFLVDENMNYYFLEMNTRLQVEHPITERVTGIDLVELQIQIASGKVLPFKQEDISQIGHSIECRIYAEDPEHNFMPCPGVIKHISEPLGFGVRTDGYVYEGYEIPIYYDPMISKLIVWGKNREISINRMKRALYEYKISGVKTNIGFLERIMNNSGFVKGNYSTHFIDDNPDLIKKQSDCFNKNSKKMITIATFMEYLKQLDRNEVSINDISQRDNWKDFGRRTNIKKF